MTITFPNGAEVVVTSYSVVNNKGLPQSGAGAVVKFSPITCLPLSKDTSCPQRPQTSSPKKYNSDSPDTSSESTSLSASEDSSDNSIIHLGDFASGPKTPSTPGPKSILKTPQKKSDAPAPERAFPLNPSVNTGKQMQSKMLNFLSTMKHQQN